jgi:hypothetical protein
MKNKLKLILSFYLILFPSTVLAQKSLVIDQLLRVDFEPTYSALVFNNDKIAIAEAELIKLEQGEILLVATLPEKAKIKNYSFILSDGADNFFATPFAKLSSINEAQTYKEKLIRKNGFLQSRINDIRDERDKLRVENQALEKEFSERINLSEILELKTNLENTNISIDFLTHIKEDLILLIENRNKPNESKDLASNSRILSQHLSDAAKVTAAAERLNIKKKETALSRFKQQLRAIEEMQQADLSAMAKQLLELRKMRGKLENTSDSSNQF